MGENDPETYKGYKPRPGQIGTARVIHPPPGTRVFKGKHLWPGEDPYAIRRRWWVVTAGAALAAFALGLLAGRFLLP
jgi:hypothetical protein